MHRTVTLKHLWIMKSLLITETHRHPFKNNHLKCIETLHLLLLIWSRPGKETAAPKHKPTVLKGTVLIWDKKIRRHEFISVAWPLSIWPSDRQNLHCTAKAHCGFFNWSKIQWHIYTNVIMQQGFRDSHQEISRHSLCLQMMNRFWVHFWWSLGSRSSAAP